MTQNYCSNCEHKKKPWFKEARCTSSQTYHPVTAKPMQATVTFITCEDKRRNHPVACPDWHCIPWSMY